MVQLLYKMYIVTRQNIMLQQNVIKTAVKCNNTAKYYTTAKCNNNTIFAHICAKCDKVGSEFNKIESILLTLLHLM